MNQPKIMYYHDGRHPHIYRYEPPMAPEEYIALVDELAGTTVEAIEVVVATGILIGEPLVTQFWQITRIDNWPIQGQAI